MMWTVRDGKGQGGIQISAPGSCMDGHRKVEKVWRETNDGLGSHSHHPMYVRQERPGGKRVSEPCACVAVWCFIKANVG